ncbi:ClpP-like prohead protease/major capsid protein fusion protein [Sphingobium agri]|uniref:ATP-dependent Clp protease proteolytic subunit n=1 Tax=Sphingobium agri TaxID=2933566 RepID=A0ABT0DWG4_9SPHN|nr:ClpP-like prohead protease/major capsid protein fusion protein [Sphingobium agri]MCK0531458.1 Clp protease ClpP [Sphingobium agri]
MTDILIYGIVGDEWDGLDAKTIFGLIAGGDDDLVVRINSPGGYVMEGLAIFNALVGAKAAGRKVSVHIDGLAASMASVIAMAGDEIIMADNALMMIHNPWDVAVGDARELRAAADKLDVIRDQLVRIYSGQTGLSADELVPMLDAETWLTSEQALEQKFITSVSEASSAAACDVAAFGFKHVPDSPLISAMAMARNPRTAPAPKTKENTMNLYQTRAALVAAIAAFQKDGGTQEEIDKIRNSAVALDAKDALPATGALALSASGSSVATPPATGLSASDVQAAVAAERTRTSGIRALGKKHGMDDAFIEELIAGDTTLDAAREKILDKLADAGDGANIGHNSPMRVTQDARDKFVEGATNWILVKAGVANLVEKAAALRGETVKIDPGEFRGVRNVDLAREALSNMGINVASRDPEVIVREAMTARGAVITQTTGDFPILFENAIHRTLQASYAITPDTWSRFAGTGSVTDFRPHTRYLRGSFGALDNVNEAGEFKNKPIPDLAKEQISATTKGNIINLSRQAIVNDDMQVFSGLAVDLGRAAKLTIEIDVYALLNSNPTMNDGVALFHASHGNLAGSGAAPSVVAFDAIDVAMSQQKDVSGNEFLEISPSVLLVPRGLRGAAVTINGSEYDPDAANKLQKPNIVKGLFSDIVASPRLTGTAYYAFADPQVAPAIEVVFLNGVTEPFTDSQEGWRVDGVEWKVRHDYGVGAVNWRSAYKQPGA